MRRILCMVLAACILMAVAGCNRGSTENTPPDSTSGPGKAESTQNPSQKPTAGSPAETAQTNPSKMSFQYTSVSPDWTIIEESNVDSNYTLLEDGQGILHLINAESGYLYHRYQVAGVWSQPQQIKGATIHHLCWVGAAPDGSPCVVWEESGIDYTGNGPGQRVYKLHVTRYKDWEWREEPKTYDFKGYDGLDMIFDKLIDFAFDAQGEPHFFYKATIRADSLTVNQEEEPLWTESLFIDGYQLTEFDTYQHEVAEKMPKQFVRSIVQGIGNMCDSVRFYIDSGNVYHLMYCDENAKISEGSTTKYTAYHHSYSRDGGETWEGPFVLFENRIDPYENGDSYKGIENVSIYEDREGNLQIPVILTAIHPTAILTVSLKAGTFEAMPERYFGGQEIREALSSLDLEEISIINGMEFKTVISDSGGQLHFVTTGVWSQPWVISWIEGNVWALRDVEQPEEDANLVAIFRLRNGRFALLSKVYGKGLYYAEIPAEE